MTTRTHTVRLFGNGWKGELMEVPCPMGMNPGTVREHARRIYGAEKVDLAAWGNPDQPVTSAPPAPTQQRTELQSTPTQDYSPAPVSPTRTQSSGSGVAVLVLVALFGLGGVATLIPDSFLDSVLGPSEATEQVQEAPVPIVQVPLGVEPIAPVGVPAAEPFFTENNVQEEIVDGLGQDWDN